MKVALSGMVLGASMIGANAGPILTDMTNTASIAQTETVFDKDGTKYRLRYDATAFDSANPLNTDPVLKVVAPAGDTKISLDCTLASTGTAYEDYADITANAVGNVDITHGTVRDDYRSDATLSYLCGFKNDDGTLIDIKTVGKDANGQAATAVDGNRIQVDFQGKCDNSAGGTLAYVLVTDTYAGEKVYDADLTARVDFNCKQLKTTIPTVEVELAFKPTTSSAALLPDLNNAQSTANFNLAASLTDKTQYTATLPKSFDLGVAKPHPFYYEHGLATCVSGMCKGKLAFEYTDPLTSSVSKLDSSTSLVSEAKFVAVKPTFEDCSATAINEEKAYTHLDACYPSNEFDSAGSRVSNPSGHLLQPLVCPFRAADFPQSRPTDIEACETLGQIAVHDNRCEGILALNTGTMPADSAQNFTLVMQNGFSFDYKFVDSAALDSPLRRFQGVPAKVTFEVPQVNTTADQAAFDITLELTAAQVSTLKQTASAFIVKSDQGWTQLVTLKDNGEVDVTGVPKSSSDLTLWGQVFQKCISKTTDLTNVAIVNTDKIVDIGLASGTFVQTGACNDMFEWTGETGITVQRILGHSDKQVQMCDTDSSTKARCLEDSSSVIALSGQKAVITGICDGIGADVIAALVEFTDGNRHYAPIKCIDTCRDATIHSLSLDWAVQLTVSSSNDESKLDAPQTLSAWTDTATDTGGDLYFSTEKMAYITKSNDDCGTDGNLKISEGQIPDSVVTPGGCLVHKTVTGEDGSTSDAKDTGIVSAADLQSWISTCGASTDNGAEATLVQRFKVDYRDGYDHHDESFCTMKHISVTVEDKKVDYAEASLNVAQISDETAAERIDAKIESVQWQTCTGGYYAEAKVELEHSGNYDLAFAYTGTANTFDNPDFGYVGKVPFMLNDIITWRSQCINEQVLCSNGGGLLVPGGHDLKAQLTGSDTSDAAHNAKDMSLNFDFNVILTGTPCPETDAIAAGDVVLKLYTKDGANACATGDDMSALGNTPRADQDACGRLELRNTGEFKLRILDTTLTRKSTGSAAVVLDTRDDLFQSWSVNARYFGESISDVNVASDGFIDLVNADAFSEIKYVVYWEQCLGTACEDVSAGGRRLLRSTHVFGAGDHESIASLVILPASAQIEDAVESLDAHETQGETTTAAPDASDAAEEDSGLSGAAIAGIIVGGVFVAGGLVYVAIQASGSRVSLSVGRPKKRDYSQVRRSERFSTMNF